MTDSNNNNSGQITVAPKSSPKKKWRKFWLWFISILLLTLGSGATIAWYFIARQLSPLVEKNLTDNFDRPVKLGKVEGFTMGALNFGSTELPPTPTDPDQISIEKIQVSFNLWDFINPFQDRQKPTLNINLTLINSNIYIEQGQDDNWVDTRLKQQEAGNFDIKVKQIELKNTTLTLVPRINEQLVTPIISNLPRSVVKIESDNQEIKFNLNGNLNQKNWYQIQGKTFIDKQEVILQISGKDLEVATIDPLLPIPLEFKEGRIDPTLEIQIKAEQPTQLNGLITLKQVTSKINALPHSFKKVSGDFLFKGREIQLLQVGGEYAQAKAIVSGTIDLDQGLFLKAEIDSIFMKDLIPTLNIPKPTINIEGEIQGNLQVTGKFNQPLLTAEVITKNTLVVDKLRFKSFLGKLTFFKGTLLVQAFEAIPVFGGKMIGQGQLLLPSQDLLFDLGLINISADQLAVIYQKQFPLRAALINQGRFKLIGNGKRLKQTLAIGDGNVIVGKNMFNFNNLKIELNEKGAWQGLINTVNLDLDDLIYQLQQENNLPKLLQKSQLSGRLNVAGTLESFAANQLQAQGSVILDNENAIFQLQNFNLDRGQWTSQLKVQNLATNNYQNIQGNWAFIGSLPSYNFNDLTAWGKGNLIINGENFTIPSLNLDRKNLQVGVNFASLPVRKFLPNLPIPLNSFLTGNLTIFGKTDNLNLKRLKGEGKGRINLADGYINASNFTFEKGRWQTNATVHDVKARKINALLPSFLSPIINGTINFQGDLENFTLESLKGNGFGNLILPGGKVYLPYFTVNQSQFSATLNPQNFSLYGLPTPRQGTMGGMVLVSGSLRKPALNQIKAEGNLFFNNLLTPTYPPLNSVFQWDGQRLNLAQLTTEGLNISGFIDINSRFLGQRKAIENISLKVLARDFNLAQISLPTPFPLELEGLMNFNGNITGNGIKPQFFGDLTLANFALDALKFEPLLQGSINLNDQQETIVNLTSPLDRINLQFDSNFRPLMAEIKRDQILATLTNQTEYFDFQLTQFPLSLLRNLVSVCQAQNCLETKFPPAIERVIPPTLLAQNLAGEVSAQVSFSHADQNATGKIMIDRPIIGRIKGDRFNVDINYDQGQLNLNNGQLIKKDSLYNFDLALINQQNNTNFTLNSNIVQGDIQDILITLQLFEIADLSQTLAPPQYGTAKDLYLTSNSVNNCNPLCAPLFSLGLPHRPIWDQLLRFSEIQALLQQQRQREKETFNLPKLRELTGKFDGTITAQNLANSGIKAEFKINGGEKINSSGEITGQPWQWKDFTIDRINIIGEYNNGVMQFFPVKIDTGNATINFKGTIGNDTPSGELNINNLPLSALNNFVTFPPQINISGILNGRANFSGSKDNPTAIGQLQIVSATINQTPVQSTVGAFNYNDAKLTFWLDSILSQGAEPMTIRGSAPLKLPFATTKPQTNEIQLSFNLKNESLALLNILTKNQIEWLGGEGEVNLNLSGILEPNQNKPTNLTANGEIRLHNGMIEAQVLPEGNLTGVTGLINFDFDTVRVQNLIANFGGGQITVGGALAISNNIAQENPLFVKLDPLNIDLKRIYQGEVKGDFIITGSMLTPVLTGNLELFNGRVLLSEKSEPQTPPEDQELQLIGVTQLKDLQLRLGEKIQVTRPPILNFLAEGTLLVNGSLDAPQPEGLIRLKRGQVNLFTSQLGLAGGYEHTAIFFPERGLDPYLNIRLATSVAEARARLVPENPFSAEVTDLPATKLGQLQTVRIEAEVFGFASQLTDSLILRSNPNRSQTEIIALLGGGFVNTLGQDDPTLGLANLAGSAILGTVQDSIGQALGLTEFRLFPTSVLDENGRTSTLGLAAEASIDVTRELSVSALKILTTEQPAQFGLRYRLDDTLILRGSTDFSGDSRAVLEYEIRF